MKKLGMVFLLAIAVLIMLVVGKNLFVKSLLAQGLTKAIHVPVSIGSVDVRFRTANIEVLNLRIQNPRGFPEKMMLNVPEIAIAFDLKAFWKGKTHFHEVRLNLEELVVIRNREGQLNVDSLRPQATPQRDSAKAGSSTLPKFLIDRLVLSIGKVVYKDYSSGGEPIVKEFDLGIQNREYRNIDDPQSLVSLIMFETLTRTTLAHLANLDLSAFQQDASGILSHGLNLLGSNTDKVQKVAENLLSIFE